MTVVYLWMKWFFGRPWNTTNGWWKWDLETLSYWFSFDVWANFHETLEQPCIRLLPVIFYHISKVSRALGNDSIFNSGAVTIFSMDTSLVTFFSWFTFHWISDDLWNLSVVIVYEISLSGELTLEKIAWEGEFTLRSDPWAGLIASSGSF